jgi:hypothetical protein
MAQDPSCRPKCLTLLFLLPLLAASPLPASAQDASAPGTSSPSQFLRSGSAGALRLTHLIGASAVSGAGLGLVGVVDDVLVGQNGRAEALVIGLSGALGLGEKDVAIPFAAVTIDEAPPRPRSEVFRDGHFAGDGEARIVIPLTAEQLAAAPAFHARGPNAPGVPAQSSGTPTETQHKGPPSSTQSGGPG